MGIRDFFRKGNGNGSFDPLRDLQLAKLRVGYFVDYDLKTWEVTAYRKYDFGDGDMTDEWELTSGRDKCYLERSEDDDVLWTVSKKIPIGATGSHVRQHIIDNDDPPEEIEYQNITYFLDESGPGRMFEQGRGLPREFIYWDFIDEEGEKFVTIEQWGETDFEAATGHYVEEYQFSNILPGNLENQ